MSHSFLPLSTKTKLRIQERLLNFYKFKLLIPNNYIKSENKRIKKLPLKEYFPKKKIEIVGDGNCLFRALSKSIYDNENKHKFIRQIICDFLEWTNKKDQNYIKNMRKLKTWGTDVELRAAVRLFGCRIFIFMDRDTSWYNMIYFNEFIKKKKLITNECIYILLKSYHFSILSEIKKKN